MSTLSNNIKDAINRNFEFNVVERNAKSVFNMLNTHAKGSDDMVVLPHVDKVELTEIDALHDKVSLLWDDYKVEGTITWTPSKNDLTKDSVVFVKVE
jgi:hypothetical protein